VGRFARLVHEALRTELSRSPKGEYRQHATIPPLAAALRRRILEHLRSRRDSVLPILRSLAPGAQADVHTGGSVGAPSKDPGQGPAARCLLTPGSAHWWSTLELALGTRSEEHTSELQSRFDLVCRLLLEKKKVTQIMHR